ncbi:MAG: hypothetical protein E4G96_07835, partial [Chrysiogenales bacterium]
MPITSKKVVSCISNQKGDFTRKEIINDLSQPSADKKEARKRKKSPSPSERDAMTIDKTIDELVAAGLLKKKRNSFACAHPFSFEGRIRITGQGKGVFRLPDRDDGQISRDDTSGAHNNDLVTGRITGAKRGEIQGIVDRIVERSRNDYFARVAHTVGDAVIYTLMDSPGNMEVCAEKPPKGTPQKGDIALIR